MKLSFRLPSKRWLSLILSSFIGSVAACAAPTAKLVEHLKTHPTDRARLVGLLKKYVSAKNYEDAYLVARYLRKYIGEDGYRIYEIMGVCAYKLGDNTKARDYLDEAIRQNPQAPVAQKALRMLDSTASLVEASVAHRATGFIAEKGPTPDPANDALPATLLGIQEDGPRTAQDDYAEANRYYHEDRFNRALGVVERILASRPADVSGQLLKAQILAAQMEFAQAQQILDDLALANPNEALIFQRLGELHRDMASATKTPEHVQLSVMNYRKAMELDPKALNVRMSFAYALYSFNETQEGEEVFGEITAALTEAAKTHQVARDERELALNRARVLFLKGQTPESLDAIRRYEQTFGSDSQSLMVAGMIHLKMNQRDEAGESLEQSFKRNPQNLSSVMNIVPLLVTMDQADRALRVISMAEAEHPDSRHVVELKAQITRRVAADHDLVVRVDGPFECKYPRQLDEDEDHVVDTILSDFREAYRWEGALFGQKLDKVRVRIVTDTGLANPAFYSPDTDTITISSQWFVKLKPGSNFPLTPQQLREYSAHMVWHEFTHMLFSHRMSSAGDRKKVGECVPLWLLEGIAEWAAGGVQRGTKTAADIKALFADGAMDYRSMEQNMAVINGAKDASQNLKAYLQSYFIVKYLIGRNKDMKAGFNQFLAFNQDLLKSGGQIEAMLEKHYGLNPVEFKKGWEDQIAQDVVNREQPDLSSSPARPLLTAGLSTGGATVAAAR